MLIRINDRQFAELLPESEIGPDAERLARCDDRAARFGMTFYHDILGFREFWRGTPPGNVALSWVNLRLPDGEDYIEFMLYDKYPPLDPDGTRIELMEPMTIDGKLRGSSPAPPPVGEKKPHTGTQH